MDTNQNVMPGAETFELPGGKTGVLLLHGITISPHTMRPWGEELARAGYTVICPRLPGHGTVWQDMANVTWQDWYNTVDQAFTQLKQRCDTVFVCALSMGGTLALHLAEERPTEVAGLVLVNPSIVSRNPRAKLVPIIKYFMKAVPSMKGNIKKPGVVEEGYDRVAVKAIIALRELWASTRPNLSKVTAPALLYRSTVDKVVEADNADVILNGISSTDKEVRLLENSYHIAVLDNDAPTIFAGSIEFIQKHMPQSMPVISQVNPGVNQGTTPVANPITPAVNPVATPVSNPVPTQPNPAVNPVATPVAAPVNPAVSQATNQTNPPADQAANPVTPPEANQQNPVNPETPVTPGVN